MEIACYEESKAREETIKPTSRKRFEQEYQMASAKKKNKKGPHPEQV